MNGKWIGSGYLVAVCSATPYFSCASTAIEAGGIALVMGMTIVAGALEVSFSFIINRLRPFFPTEISGLCTLLIGVIVGVLGFREALGLDAAGAQVTASTQDMTISALTLALMIGLNLWGAGPFRIYCAIIGVVAGYLTAALLGLVDPHIVETLNSSPVFDVPHLSFPAPTFSLYLFVPFLAAALTNSVKAWAISVPRKI